MKTLYIDINNAPIKGNAEIELLSYDLQEDFYYSLGGSIKGNVRGVSSNIDLVEKYVKSEGNAKFIEEAWKTVKEVLFSENPEEGVPVTLPREYLEWLRYNNDDSYRNIYEQLYGGQNSASVTINMEELYEDAVSGTLYRQIRRCLKDNVDIEELVFNDNCVSRKSVIVRTIKKNFENVGFVPFEKWGEGSNIGEEETPGKESEYQIIAKLEHKSGVFRFIDSNGEICNPDLCERVENDYYSCECDFSNFYKKENEYFHISSEGIKRLGCFREANLLNEDLIAVQYNSASWQVLDKKGKTVPLSCQVYKIFGINSLGYALCGLSSCEYGFIHVYSGELLKIGIDEELEDEGYEIVMSPFSSLVVFTLDAGEFYYDFENKVLKSAHLPDYHIRVHGNDIIALDSKRERAVYNIFGNKLAKFHWGIRDNIRGVLYGNRNENSSQIFNVNTKELLPLELEYGFGDFFVASDRNEKKSLYRISNGENIISNVGSISPIIVQHGNYALIKKGTYLILVNLEDKKETILLSHSNLKEETIIYSYNQDVINLGVSIDNFNKVSSFSFDYSGEIIAEGNRLTHGLVYAMDKDTISNLDLGNLCDICDDIKCCGEYDYESSEQGIINYKGDLICSTDKMWEDFPDEIGEWSSFSFIDKSHMSDNQIIAAE